MTTVRNLESPLRVVWNRTECVLLGLSDSRENSVKVRVVWNRTECVLLGLTDSRENSVKFWLVRKWFQECKNPETIVLLIKLNLHEEFNFNVHRVFHIVKQFALLREILKKLVNWLGIDCHEKSHKFKPRLAVGDCMCIQQVIEIPLKLQLEKCNQHAWKTAT